MYLLLNDIEHKRISKVVNESMNNWNVHYSVVWFAKLISWKCSFTLLIKYSAPVPSSRNRKNFEETENVSWVAISLNRKS